MFDTRLIRQDFSDAASHYDLQTPLQQHVLSRLAEKMLYLLPPGAKILDAGCGTGRLARQYPNYQITQLDAAQMMCSQAAMPNAPAVMGAVESLPFKDGAFEAVLCSLVLQWVEDREKAMNEMQRVLKPGGILGASIFGPSTLMELKESFTIVDSHAHVSTFAASPEFNQQEVVTEHYPDLLALMRHLKTIGARNKLLKRRKSLMTRRHMRRVEQHYKKCFATPLGLPVTWEILYAVVHKP